MARLMKTAFIAFLAMMAVPALAASVKSAQGVSYWSGDPGPISDPYWTSGQYKYDPDGYLLRNGWQPDQFHLMTAIGDHDGKENCVFRKRVTVTTWEFEHPILRVCRTPPKN